MNRVLEDVRSFRKRMKAVEDACVGQSAESLMMLIALMDGPMQMHELAEVLCVTNGAATNLADRLVKWDQMTRDRSTEDRRVVLVGLNKFGMAKAEMAVAAYEKAFPASGPAKE
jgi:DNA-binding MarR family transcriptional regulator